MGELYSRVATLDKGIADRWKLRTREDKSRRLTPADVNAIMGPVFAPGKKITENQGKALILIFEPPTTFTPEATKRVLFYVNHAQEAHNLNLVHLANDADLAQVYKALRQDVVGSIIFKSPGTGITYTPFDYLVISDLVSLQYISVYESRLGGLSRVADSRGMYRSNLNRLILYESDDPVRKTSTIVHEVTHAIQDWKDVRGITRDVEADAFIAGAVVEQTLKRSKIAYIDIDFDDPVHAAARLVIEKKVDERDKVWRGAYDKVVTEVSTSYEFPLLRKNPGREAVVESKIYAQVRSAVDLRQMMWEHMRTSTAQLQRQMSKIDLSSYVGRPQ